MVVLQPERLGEVASVTICGFTSNATQVFYRVEVSPSPENGLTTLSRVMADKVTTLPRNKLGKQIGALNPEDLARLDRGLLAFLGLLPEQSR